ncbi:hypothetical protein AX14_002938 [Amanita brunnescens Koide BX004]|nr:hypothetical protein AX14_002938 [Amanita brunnescens Koide BX004]
MSPHAQTSIAANDQNRGTTNDASLPTKDRKGSQSQRQHSVTADAMRPQTPASHQPTESNLGLLSEQDRVTQPSHSHEDGNEEVAFDGSESDTSNLPNRSQTQQTSTSAGEKRGCNICVKKYGSAYIPPGVKNFLYSLKTSNSNLRAHLKTEHNELYTMMCQERRWPYLTSKLSQPTIEEQHKISFPPFLSTALLEYLVRFIVADDQIGHITLDNAENNTTAMQELQKLLDSHGVKFDHLDNHIGGYPHIINICVSHIIASASKLSEADFLQQNHSEHFTGDNESSDNEDMFDPEYYIRGESEVDANDILVYDTDNADLQDWISNLKQDPVKRARAAVRILWSSGQRRDEFAWLIHTGNELGWFQDPENRAIIMQELQVLKDVKTCWDSLYCMLERLHVLRPVVRESSIMFATNANLR